MQKHTQPFCLKAFQRPSLLVGASEVVCLGCKETILYQDLEEHRSRDGRNPCRKLGYGIHALIVAFKENELSVCFEIPTSLDLGNAILELRPKKK